MTTTQQGDGIHPDSSAPLNAELLELLCQLKEAYHSHVDSHISLKKLINDMDYRREILDRAMHTENKKIRDIAAKAWHIHHHVVNKRNSSKPTTHQLLHGQTDEAMSNVKPIIEGFQPVKPSNNNPIDTQSIPDKIDLNEDVREKQKAKPIFKGVIAIILLLMVGVITLLIFAPPEPSPPSISKQNSSEPVIPAIVPSVAPSISSETELSEPTAPLVLPEEKVIEAENEEAIITVEAAEESLSIAEQTTTDDRQVLFRIHGSNTIGETLAPVLVKAYLQTMDINEIKTVKGTNPVEQTMIGHLGSQGNVAVELAAHGSSTGFKSLYHEQTDIAMSSRKITLEELQPLGSKYGMLTAMMSEHVIGLDGLAIIVHPENPLNALTVTQIAHLFSGEITDWATLGGLPGPVHVYARDHQSGTWDTFKSLVLASNDVVLSESALRFESSSELSDKVSVDRGGIGFIGLPSVRSAKLLAVAESHNTASIFPADFTISAEDYALSRRLFMYIPQNANTKVRDFINFTLSAAGQDIVHQHGFVSQNVYAQKPPQSTANYPKKYMEYVENAQRLSLSLRFDSSSNALENKAKRDLERIVKFLFKNKDRKVYLFGFADSSGRRAVNLALSQQRVNIVKQALIARGIHPTISVGFGEAIPMASNETVFGRYKNRRVEIWVD